MALLKILFWQLIKSFLPPISSFFFKFNLEDIGTEFNYVTR